MAENVIGHLLGHARPVSRRHRSLVAQQHRLQRLSHLMLEFALIQLGVVERRSEHLEQGLVDSCASAGRTGLHAVPSAAGTPRRSTMGTVG